MADIFYYPELGINGTLDELLDWAYRYDSDYTDEALKMIADIAKGCEYDPEYKIPLLVIADRRRQKEQPETLPYEQMQLDKLVYGKIGYSETKPYGEVEIREEGDKVLISVTGMDDEGLFTAAGSYSVEEFMNGEGNFLEIGVGMILSLQKVYEDEVEER